MSLSLFFQKCLFLAVLFFALHHQFQAVPTGPTTCSDCSTCLSLSISHVLIASDFHTGDFRGCSTIAEVTFGSAVSSIPKDAFNGASSLAAVFFDASSSISSIEYNAFNFTGLSGPLTIPNGVTTIRANAFSWVNTLTSITIPDSVYNIDIDAFRGTGLTTVTFSGNNTRGLNIAYGAFKGISSLTGTIALPAGVGIGTSSFGGLESDVFTGSGSGSLELDLSACRTTTMGYRQFAGFSGLTSVKFPHTLESIYICAFCGTKLVSVVLPDRLRSFDTAFQDIPTLTSISIPDSVTAIDYYALRGSSNLATLIFSGSSYDLRIFNNAFSGTKLVSVILPNGVNSISNAFSGISSLTFLSIPSTVATIVERAFNASGLTSVTFTGATFASGLNIAAGGFAGLSNLATVNFGSANFSSPGLVIGNNAFAGLKKLTGTFTLPTGITSLGTGVFSGSGVTSPSPAVTLVLPSDLTTITASAFAGFVGLKTVVIPHTVTSIGNDAFNGATGLSSLIFTGDFTTNKLTIGDSAFYQTALTGSLVLPEGLTSVGVSSFQGLTSVTTLTIPDSLTTIGSLAFQGSGVGRCLIWDLSVLRKVTGDAFDSFVNCTLTTEPTEMPSVTPSVAPTPTPSATPSEAPSQVPSVTPSATPSEAPSQVPSGTPTAIPSVAPSEAPSQEPSMAPSVSPTDTPSTQPSAESNQVPSIEPTVTPSQVPTVSVAPAVQTVAPSTRAPTQKASQKPSTYLPTVKPYIEIFFDTSLILNNVNAPTLDEGAKATVCGAVTNTLGLAVQKCLFVNQTTVNAARRQLTPAGFKIKADVRISATTGDFTDTENDSTADNLYAKLVDLLTVATANTVFADTLQELSTHFNTTASFDGVSVAPAEFTPYTVVVYSSSDKDTAKGLSDGALAGIVIGAVVAAFLIVLAVWYGSGKGQQKVQPGHAVEHGNQHTEVKYKAKQEV